MSLSSATECDDTLYLGLDLSTQSLTATVVNSAGAETHSVSVNFDEELLNHKTPVNR
eukprot:IDg16604t1